MSENKEHPTWGGFRPGAGRKPSIARRADSLERQLDKQRRSFERGIARLAVKFPNLVAMLVDLALKGNVDALKFLVDRYLRLYQPTTDDEKAQLRVYIERIREIISAPQPRALGEGDAGDAGSPKGGTHSRTGYSLPAPREVQVSDGGRTGGEEPGGSALPYS